MGLFVLAIRIFVVILIFLGVLKLLTRKKTKPNSIKDRVVSVQEISLRISGMRFTYIYKIVPEFENIKLELYRDGVSGLELEKSIICRNDVILELLNSCNVQYWNGFHGNHPKSVSDGIMFTFLATINSGSTIWAEGSENFPDGYHKFVGVLNKMLSETD